MEVERKRALANGTDNIAADASERSHLHADFATENYKNTKVSPFFLRGLPPTERSFNVINLTTRNIKKKEMGSKIKVDSTECGRVFPSMYSFKRWPLTEKVYPELSFMISVVPYEKTLTTVKGLLHLDLSLPGRKHSEPRVKKKNLHFGLVLFVSNLPIMKTFHLIFIDIGILICLIPKLIQLLICKTLRS